MTDKSQPLSGAAPESFNYILTGNYLAGDRRICCRKDEPCLAHQLVPAAAPVAVPAGPRQTDEELLNEYVDIWENCTDQPIAPENREALRKIIERKHL